MTNKSEKHELMTLEQNRVALSAYCDKRFYLDPINSLPFGQKNIREFAFHNVILNDWDWESENESDLDSISQPTPENVISENKSFSPPDPGFNQPDYSESELDQDIVDWNEPFAISPPAFDNSFLEMEAVESEASNNSDMSDLSSSNSLIIEPTPKRRRLVLYNSSSEDN